ncbi:hypothetical protein Bbelb_035310 [Branchiostoma belcheri]|nr:hypothetical protein Bbelb_035310 [Branchiostoma belcheri]
MVYESFSTGSALTLKYTCPKSHCGYWHSQPHVGDSTSFEGNLLLPVAIIIAGGTFTKFSDIAQTLSLQCFGETQFKEVQRKVVFPVIDEHYLSEQQGILSLFCNQVSETTSSQAMEKMGFLRSLEFLQSEGMNIECIATDRHEDEDAAAEREEYREEWDRFEDMAGLASPSVAVQPLPAPVISRCPFGEESVPGGRVARNDMADSLSRLQDGDVDSGYESRDEWDTPEEDFWERRTRLTILRAAITKINRLQQTLKTPTLHKFNWEQPAQKDQQIEDIERRLATPMLVNIRSCAALDTWRADKDTDAIFYPEKAAFQLDRKAWENLKATQVDRQFTDPSWRGLVINGLKESNKACSFTLKRHRVKTTNSRKSKAGDCPTSLTATTELEQDLMDISDSIGDLSLEMEGAMEPEEEHGTPAPGDDEITTP